SPASSREPACSACRSARSHRRLKPGPGGGRCRLRRQTSAPMDDMRLGAILLEGGIVDEAGLERCLAIQTLTGNTRPIGQIVVEQGLVDADTVKRVLELQKGRAEAARAKVAPDNL